MTSRISNRYHSIQNLILHLLSRKIWANFEKSRKKKFSTPNFGRVFDLIPGRFRMFDYIFLILYIKKYRKNIPIVLWRPVTRSKYWKTKKKSFFGHKSTPTQNHVAFLNFWRLQAHSEFNSTSFEPKTRRRTALRAARYSPVPFWNNPGALEF